MSIECKFPSRADAQRAGWFSRRHETSVPHDTERNNRRGKQQAKLDWAAEQNQRTADNKSKELEKAHEKQEQDMKKEKKQKADKKLEKQNS